MQYITDFERALDLLSADRSPRSCTPALSDHELRMLAVAQILRGSRYQQASPTIVWALRNTIMPQHLPPGWES